MNATATGFGCLSVVNFLGWGGLALFGVKHWIGPGYSSAEQATFYLLLPLSMLAMSIGVSALSYHFHRHAIGGTFAFLAIGSILPYFMLFGGGV